MAYIYEGMFLLDNDLVRSGWESAKDIVTQLLQKHGATVHTARRWDERALAYPIKGKRRATFLLTYFEFEGSQMEPLNRDLEITDGVLRYINLRKEEVPADEREAAGKESEADFEVPEPPADDAGAYRPIQDGSADEEEDIPDYDGDLMSARPGERRAPRVDTDSDKSSEKTSEKSEPKAEAGESKTADEPKAEEPKAEEPAQ